MDRFEFIKRLRPIGFLFEPYGSCLIPIKDAPKLFSSYRYHTAKGYHYTVTGISNEFISLELESVCHYNGIIFEPVELKLKDFADMVIKALKENENFITVAVEIRDNTEAVNCYECLRENEGCRQLKGDMGVKDLRIYFDREEMRKAVDYCNKFTSNGDKSPRNSANKPALSTSGVVSYKPKQNKEKEKKTMANQNLFGINLKIGMVTDPNIAATALGICFKNEAGNWIYFDKSTGKRTDLGSLQLGNFPLYMIPSRNVEVGDPILYEDAPYYVIDNSQAPKLTLLSVTDGVEKVVYPATNVLGINFFTKIVALIDTDKLLSGNADDLPMVLALSNMSGNPESGDQNQQLMNLLFLTTALGDNGSIMDGILGGGNEDDGPMGKMLPLMLLGGMNGQGNMQGGMDMNALLPLILLGGKRKPKETTVPPKTEAGGPLLEEFRQLLARVNPEEERTKAAEKPVESSITEDRISEMIEAAIAKMKAAEEPREVPREEYGD